MRQEFISQANNLYVFNRLFSIKQLLNPFFGYPLTINLLITNECNLRCRICSAQDMLGKGEQLTKEEITKFIREITYLNPSIFIGGGEPFMRGDILEILSAIKTNNLRCGIVTNGILLDKQKIDRLLEIEPEVIIFSVYGNRELHERINGEKKSFMLFCDNLAYLNKKRKRMRLLLNCVINQENYEHLEDIVALAKDLEVDFVRFEHLIFVTKEEHEKHLIVCAESFPKDDCRLTTFINDIDNPKMSQRLSEIIPSLQKKYKNFVIFKPYLDKRELSMWYTKGFLLKRRCFFVRHSLFIKPNGDVIPCQFFGNFILGNIKKDNLMQFWKSEKRKVFKSALKKGLFPGCMRCCKL